MMRAVDHNSALRHDLVCILKDVVGLIARIEASIPPSGGDEAAGFDSRSLAEDRCDDGSNPSAAAQSGAVADPGGAGRPDGGERPAPHSPQPAPFPGVQNEASGNHGGDQRAQKSEAAATATEAGAAQAGLHSADRRNSSREAGEVASAPLPADRTPSIGTMAEQALELWSTTDLSREQIALRVGCGKDSVRSFISQGRAAGDQRGFARMPIKANPPTPMVAAKHVQTIEKPVLIPRKDEEREPPVSGFAKPVERKPFSKPLDPRPGRLPGVVITSPGSVVALDMDNLVVACPGGDWQVSRPVALIIERMRNGEMFDDQTLAEVGTMGLSTFADSRNRWTEELAKRGVEFVHTKGVGCKIRVAGT